MKIVSKKFQTIMVNHNSFSARNLTRYQKKLEADGYELVEQKFMPGRSDPVLVYKKKVKSNEEK